MKRLIRAQEDKMFFVEYVSKKTDDKVTEHTFAKDAEEARKKFENDKNVRYICSVVEGSSNIKASLFQKINRVLFVDLLVDALKQLLPKNCYPTYTYRSEIEISKLPTKKKFETAVVKACYEFGYIPYDYSSGVIAAVKNDAYAKLFLFYDPFDERGYINVHCDTGRASIEDWFEDENIIADI